MNEAEILALAIDARNEHARSNAPGVAVVSVLVNRLPSSRYIKQMRIRNSQGPRGKILAIQADGTVVEFEAGKLIDFFHALAPGNRNDEPRKLEPRTADRVQVKSVIQRSNVEQIKELAALKNLTLSAIMDHALSAYIENHRELYA